MKKNLLFLFACVVLASSLQAQNAEDSYKKAKRAYNVFVNSTEITSNGDKLEDAKKAIDEAITYPENQNLPEVWIKRGLIYNGTWELSRSLAAVGKVYKTDPKGAIEAYNAFNKAISLATKKGDVKDALEGLAETQDFLNTNGVLKYDLKDYAGAYYDFKAAIDAHDLLKSKGAESKLDGADRLKNQYTSVLTCAYLGKIMKEAQPVIEKMYSMKKDSLDSPLVYESLYTLKAETDKDAALKILEEGRAKYPEETSLLFAEINHYLKSEKLDILIDKLKLGIQKEPENMALYLTLGNVYDKLGSDAMDKGDKVKSKEYNDLAISYYQQVLDKDPLNFDGLYSLGTIHYNHAAAQIKELNELANDLSKEGERKYQAKQAEIDASFKESLPYFQKAESLNPNDKNTLIALKEIYIKIGDINTSNEFKKRLETVEGGGQNKSYFNK